MKKVGIVTLSGHFNYGNRLQNYALQEVIKKLGYEVETIWNNDCTEKEALVRKIKMCIHYILRFITTNDKKNYVIRHSKFKRFSKKYIRDSKYTLSVRNVPKNINNDYDYFVVGSDQIWNYNLFEITGKEFLSFSNYDKNIAYAPSLGVSNIEEGWKNFYKENLKNIRCLSCREKVGAEIISELTNRDCSVVLDPTMLLTKEEWEKTIEKPKFMTNKNYILLYFLGDISEVADKEIKRIAEENNYDVINILDFQSKYYTCDPSEFLYLVKNASVVCTDSFHASVFSIIFGVPFFVFDRVQKGLSSMNSRIDTLLSKFGLEDRKFNDKFNTNFLECNYKEAVNCLEKERKKSIEYLKQSLK